MGIGKQFLKANDLVEAILAFERSLEVNYTISYPWFYKGICFALLDPHSDLYFQKAVECVREAFARNCDFETWERLGNIYKEANEFKKAISSFYREVVSNTNNYNAWYKLGRCFEGLFNFRGAQRAYEMALKKGELSLERSLKIAKFYEHIGELGSANEIFKRVLRQKAPISAQKNL